PSTPGHILRRRTYGIPRTHDAGPETELHRRREHPRTHTLQHASAFHSRNARTHHPPHIFEEFEEDLDIYAERMDFTIHARARSDLLQNPTVLADPAYYYTIGQDEAEHHAKKLGKAYLRAFTHREDSFTRPEGDPVALQGFRTARGVSSDQLSLNSRKALFKTVDHIEDLISGKALYTAYQATTETTEGSESVRFGIGTSENHAIHFLAELKQREDTQHTSTLRHYLFEGGVGEDHQGFSVAYRNGQTKSTGQEFGLSLRALYDTGQNVPEGYVGAFYSWK
ncbi:MAG: hypothetical protein HC945_03045, partial [Nitrosarchaeum sp.]|nr:hypothetical protein [Nitrosarchaeum sp.]